MSGILSGTGTATACPELAATGARPVGQVSADERALRLGAVRRSLAAPDPEESEDEGPCTTAHARLTASPLSNL